MTDRNRPWPRRPVMCIVCTTMLIAAAAHRATAEQGPAVFDSPDAALQALKDATQSPEKGALSKVFGDDVKALVSGDEVQDRADVIEFGRQLQQASRWEPNEDGSMTLAVGVDEWPFPVPLVKRDGKWVFDIDAGKEEIVDRRVGRNELRTIAVCRALVVAEREYAAADRDGDNVLEFAQHLRSAPGQHDGLYWETAEGEPLSPLGPLVAEARAEGYGANPSAGDQGGPHPYHGYLYRILTKQGANAPGGALDYVINGNMVAGFAAIVYPVDYDDSGVMTFLVGPNGQIYQKDLGAETAKLASEMEAFDPDATWTLVQDGAASDGSTSMERNADRD